MSGPERLGVFVIELDVGGTRFKTSRSTLCRCGGREALVDEKKRSREYLNASEHDCDAKYYAHAFVAS